MRSIAILGVVMIAAGIMLRNAPYTLPGHENFYTTSPLYIMIRIGCILLISVLLYIMETGIQWVPRPIQLAGQESLLVYGVHIWLIFAFLRGKRVGQILGLETGYLGCFLLSAAITLLMLFLAKYWHALKKSYPAYAKFGQAITVLIMIAVFLLS
jgi:fucose 4-O-acetylase-like acetyltransferase